MNLLQKIVGISLLALPFTLAAASNQMAELPETTGLVSAGNKAVVLLGHQVNVGDQAPNFKVVDERFSPVTLDKFQGKPILISVVPSLDTGVCSIQTKRFNEEVAKLPEDVVMLTISNDLPFAQKRFCKAENIDKVKVLSDAVWRDFGAHYGLLIKDMGLLTRAIIVIDTDGKIAYKELVSNISNHPDYDMALSAIKSVSTSVNMPENTQSEDNQLPKTEPTTSSEVKTQ
jgi:thiol peroxidase